MLYVRIWVHCVWVTKSHIPFLTPEYKRTIIDHIKENAKEKGIYIDFINGSKDHLHANISLNPDQNIAKAMQLIKGESSHWINKNKVTEHYFEWADEYFAVSISESRVNKV